MCPCLLSRVAPPAPEIRTEVGAASPDELGAACPDEVAARDRLVRRLRWNALLADLHTRAGIPTYRWMWDSRALHWTAFDRGRGRSAPDPQHPVRRT